MQTTSATLLSDLTRADNMVAWSQFVRWQVWAERCDVLPLRPYDNMDTPLPPPKPAPPPKKM